MVDSKSINLYFQTIYIDTHQSKQRDGLYIFPSAELGSYISKKMEPHARAGSYPSYI